MRGEDFPRNPKCLFPSRIWAGSPALQGGFRNPDLIFHKRWIFFSSSHIWPWPEVCRQKRKLFQPTTHFSTLGKAPLYSVNAKAQFPSGLCTFFEVGVYFAWSALTFWFLLLFPPIVAGELWPLPGFLVGLLFSGQVHGRFPRTGEMASVFPCWSTSYSFDYYKTWREIKLINDPCN